MKNYFKMSPVFEKASGLVDPSCKSVECVSWGGRGGGRSGWYIPARRLQSLPALLIWRCRKTCSNRWYGRSMMYICSLGASSEFRLRVDTVDSFSGLVGLGRMGWVMCWNGYRSALNVTMAIRDWIGGREGWWYIPARHLQSLLRVLIWRCRYGLVDL